MQQSGGAPTRAMMGVEEREMIRNMRSVGLAKNKILTQDQYESSACLH